MGKGFPVKKVGFSWIPAEIIKQFSFIKGDLNDAVLWQYFPARARYKLSYHCPTCNIFVSEASASFSKAEAGGLAGAIGHS